MEIKKTDNTPLIEIDRISTPASSTQTDRYTYATHWCKGKTVLDAASGKGYGAGILLALGATKVTGIDIDVKGMEAANNIYQSPNINFKVCDIFNLKKEFKENEFDVCTSIETFEHLPPDRIDEYLQQLKYVTKETVIITTPRRKEARWHYKGGTHLYEYNSKEFTDILYRNFPDSEITGFGLNEVVMPSGNQIATDLIHDLGNCTVFFAAIEMEK